MSHRRPKNRNHRTDYQHGFEEGMHDRDRGLSEPGNLGSFPARFRKGYQDARNSTATRIPVERSRPKRESTDESEIDYELISIQYADD